MTVKSDGYSSAATATVTVVKWLGNVMIATYIHWSPSYTAAAAAAAVFCYYSCTGEAL